MTSHGDLILFVVWLLTKHELLQIGRIKLLATSTNKTMVSKLLQITFVTFRIALFKGSHFPACFATSFGGPYWPNDGLQALETGLWNEETPALFLTSQCDDKESVTQTEQQENGERWRHLLSTKTKVDRSLPHPGAWLMTSILVKLYWLSICKSKCIIAVQ